MLSSLAKTFLQPPDFKRSKCANKEKKTETLLHSLTDRDQERDSWNSTLHPGGKYYLTRNASTLVAFAIGKKWQVRICTLQHFYEKKKKREKTFLMALKAW
jgi:aspartyl aminopeptidase